jgi:hypothetical protein
LASVAASIFFPDAVRGLRVERRSGAVPVRVSSSFGVGRRRSFGVAPAPFAAAVPLAATVAGATLGVAPAAGRPSFVVVVAAAVAARPPVACPRPRPAAFVVAVARLLELAIAVGAQE